MTQQKSNNEIYPDADSYRCGNCCHEGSFYGEPSVKCPMCKNIIQKQKSKREQAITALAQSVCQELTGWLEGSVDGQGEFIEELIKQWLSNNLYVRKADDQSLPENPYGRYHALDSMNGAYYRSQQDILAPKDGTVWVKIETEE